MKKQPFTPEHTYRIEGETYRSEMRCLAPDLLFMKRHQTFRREQHIVDTFASFWFLGFPSKLDCTVAIRDGAEFRPLRENELVFIPPFTLVEWKVSPGELQWDAYFSDTALPGDLPREPSLVSVESPDGISDTRSAMQLLREARLRPLEQQRVPSALARRAKDLIDANFACDTKISDIAKTLRTSRVSLHSTFTRAYGLTPVAYRHRLRVFDSFRNLNRGQSVTESLLAAGFNQPAQYIEHFREYLQTTPMAYAPRKARVMAQSPERNKP